MTRYQPVPFAAARSLRPIFYDESQRRRFWFFGLSGMCTLVASLLLYGFVLSVQAPPAFAHDAARHETGG
jgi:hypothetical protein